MRWLTSLFVALYGLFFVFFMSFVVQLCSRTARQGHRAGSETRAPRLASQRPSFPASQHSISSMMPLRGRFQPGGAGTKKEPTGPPGAVSS